jgi:hypothetical protein
MTQSNASDPGNTKEAKLPRRDWIVLPVISLLTICLLLTSTELIARRMFTQLDTIGEDCMVFNDPSTGPRGIPNSVCREKIPEGELTEYQFNSCGHRAGMECGPKSPGTYRIVMIGTSLVLGMRVPREKTFAALLPLELSRRTGLKVELYNEATPYKYPDTIALHFDEVLKAKPDMVLWALVSGDINSQSQLVPPTPASVRNLHPSFPAWAWYRMKAIFATKSFTASLAEIFRRSRTATLLCQFLYDSPSLYVKLMEIDDGMAYLRAEPSAEWQKQLKEFDNNAARIEAQARDAGVPFVVVLLPRHADVDMISRGEWPAGYDPYRLDNELRAIITSHGGIYIDILPDIHSTPSLQQGYFQVEGHLNARGHAILSGLLAEELTNGAVPALRVVARPQVALKKGR